MLSELGCQACGQKIKRFLKRLDFFFDDGTDMEFTIKEKLGPCMRCGERAALMFLVDEMLSSIQQAPKSLIATYDNAERHCLWVN